MPLRVFDVDLVHDLRPGALYWPTPAEAADESGCGGNRDYVDLRGLGWAAVAEMLERERGLLVDLRRESDPGAVWAEREESFFEEDAHPLEGRDLGVASAVYALSAAGCVPFTSCNGGALGDYGHAEAYPLVAFYLRRDRVDTVLAAAVESGVGLRQHEHGSVHVYARQLEQMCDFAEALMRRCTASGGDFETTRRDAQDSQIP